MQGVITALITPFTNGELDEEGFKENLHFQLEHKIDGVLLFGTTGEGPTLTEAEKIRMLQIARKETEGKCHLMVATGTNATESTIRLTKLAEHYGVDSCLVVTPYYNKPTQEGLYRHYQALSQNVCTPLYIYHIPGRTACKIAPQTISRLAELPHITGIKESTGDLQGTSELMARVKSSFTLFSGDDSLTLPLMALGARGVISVASNIIPLEIKKLVGACLEENYTAARELHYQLVPLFHALFIETNPIPLKALMQANGYAAGPCRLPLTELADENQKLIRTFKIAQALHG